MNLSSMEKVLMRGSQIINIGLVLSPILYTIFLTTSSCQESSRSSSDVKQTEENYPVESNNSPVTQPNPPQPAGCDVTLDPEQISVPSCKQQAIAYRAAVASGKERGQEVNENPWQDAITASVKEQGKKRNSSPKPITQTQEAFEGVQCYDNGYCYDASGFVVYP